MSFFCKVCGSNQCTEKLTCIDHTVSKEKFTIVECNSCRLWQTFPLPDEENIQRYYLSQDYISHSDKKDTFFDKLYHLVRKYTIVQKTNLVKKYVPRGTILDFGCGTGYFLENCKKENFNVLGLEVNDTARGISESKGIKVFQNINELSDFNNKVDIITLWHVFEHLYNPKFYLKYFYDLLKDNGFLLLALPNRNSYDAKYYKELWAGYDVPRHVFHFTSQDINNITKEQFNVLGIYPMYFDSFYVSILSEKYKQSKIAFINGLYRGLLSNLKAINTGQYSSLIYVLQKK